MVPALSQSSRDWRDTDTRRRAVSIVLAVLVHLVMLLALIRLTPATVERMARSGGAITVDLLPDAAKQAQRAPRAVPVARQKRAPAQARPRPPATPPPPVEDTRPLALIPLTHDEFAAGDIGTLPSRKPAGDTGPQADAAGGGPGKAARGPGGEQLYNADWYREPTSAELAFYLPKRGGAVGWGEIACRTVAGYRVEDCVLLGESPAGSGLGRAVLNAAWQFRVTPPRIGGRPLVGRWVRIRIEYSERGARRAD